MYLSRQPGVHGHLRAQGSSTCQTHILTSWFPCTGRLEGTRAWPSPVASVHSLRHSARALGWSLKWPFRVHGFAQATMGTDLGHAPAGSGIPLLAGQGVGDPCFILKHTRPGLLRDPSPPYSSQASHWRLLSSLHYGSCPAPGTATRVSTRVSGPRNSETAKAGNSFPHAQVQAQGNSPRHT